MRLLAVVIFALMTAACNQEPDVTGSTPGLCDAELQLLQSP